MLSVIRASTRRSILLPLSKRTLSYSKPLLQGKKKKDVKQSKSILNDDLLFKAGMDVDAKPEETHPLHEKKTKKYRKTTTDIKRERYSNWFYIFSFSALSGTALYMTRDWDSNESEEWKAQVADGYTPELMYKRFKIRFNSMFTFFQEPPFPDLLPPPPPEPYQRPLTLVLSLEDLLVHSEWTQKNGWRTAKRPGVDYFLGYLSQYYEIVLFSSNYMMYSEKIAEKLDPIHAFISYNLFKEHCVYKKGKHIKDLSKLNRDVNKVIIIDTDKNNYKLQPENAIPMKPWSGTADDELIKLIPFLEYLATQQVNNVKPILNSFHDRYKLSDEFNERVVNLRKKFQEENKTKKNNNWALKFLGVSSNSNAGKFPLDMIREEGEKNYVRFMKIIEEEKEKIRIQQEQMKNQTFTLKDYVEGNIPTPEEQMQKQLEQQKEIDELYEKQKREGQEK
ncbi:hypothetical protein KAFR_0E01020 [Kazachstania africana CBS 2517]|uniref:Mitochondrial import inner membrane translocase subunit TIM50 n=1 Tax=Kazachstania africana (strain ATCC 22294 / BCRC 22015 / CBS 2517 / CECT 1963 / NBRC 1671 / NRRL Y-8276) TaxID=1071382 RepID=H2AV56_KAZAF|nr:hypothetical protein KAFR_0E01020 [Kazachstania africana CBS 2517]CCF58256.1 hypothetical protein KAFR_0E01020 [Kazachstania africana CBS 2517]